MARFYVYGSIAIISAIGIAGYAEGDCWIVSIVCLLVFGFCSYMAAVEVERYEHRMQREHEKLMRELKKKNSPATDQSNKDY